MEKHMGYESNLKTPGAPKILVWASVVSDRPSICYPNSSLKEIPYMEVYSENHP
jgi:hypothetical protein